MTHNEDDTGRHELLGRGNRLVCVTVVVGSDDLDGLTKETACLVELAHGQFDPTLVLLAIP
jgi:hypothetical protein